jgi:hypothetical protein
MFSAIQFGLDFVQIKDDWLFWSDCKLTKAFWVRSSISECFCFSIYISADENSNCFMWTNEDDVDGKVLRFFGVSSFCDLLSSLSFIFHSIQCLIDEMSEISTTTHQLSTLTIFFCHTDSRACSTLFPKVDWIDFSKNIFHSSLQLLLVLKNSHCKRNRMCVEICRWRVYF